MFGQTNQGDLHEREDKDKGNYSELKTKRDEYLDQIHTSKREEQLFSKREKELEKESETENERLKTLVEEWRNQTYDPSTFADLLSDARSGERLKKHYALIGINKLLASNTSWIQLVIDACLVDQLVKHVLDNNEPYLQIEAASVLTFITYGTEKQILSIVKTEGIPKMLKLLNSDNDELLKEIILIVGNIACEQLEFRQLILNSGGFGYLLKILDTKDHSLKKDAAWAIASLVSGNILRFDQLAIPILFKAMENEADLITLQNVAAGLSYQVGACNEIENYLTKEHVVKLFEFIENGNNSVITFCLCIFENIFEKSEKLAQETLEMPEFLAIVFKLLYTNRSSVRQEACTLLSFIVKNQNHVDKTVGNPYYFDMIINRALNDVPEVQVECLKILLNAIEHGSLEVVGKLIDFGIFDCLLHFLDLEAHKQIAISLMGIDNILKYGHVMALKNQSPENELLVLLEIKGGLEKIESLQNHSNQLVYKNALKVLENHFEVDDII